VSSPSKTSLRLAGLRGVLFGAVFSSVAYLLTFAIGASGSFGLFDALANVLWAITYFTVLFGGMSVIPFYLTPPILGRSHHYQTHEEAVWYGFIGTVLTSAAVFLTLSGVNFLGTLRFRYGDDPLQITITLLGCTILALCLVEPFPLILRMQTSMRRERERSAARSQWG
jgi:hypothetical protein